MSEAKRKLPPGFSTRANRSRLLLADEAAFPVLLLRPRIGIEQIDAVQRSRPATSRGPRRVIVVEPDIGERMLLRGRPSACAMLLTKGSTPMKPVAGQRRASCSRCSPPPKPISSRTDFDRPQKAEASRLRCRRARSSQIHRQLVTQERDLQGPHRLAASSAEEGFGRPAAPFGGHCNSWQLRRRERP